MAKAFRTCKVCGKQYEYCHTFRRTPDMFRWQDVACCPEHGSIYLNRILESRAKRSQNVEPGTSEHSDDKTNI